MDNALWGGSVTRPTEDADTAALEDLNRKLHDDEPIDPSLLPSNSGLTLARKR